MHIKTRTVTLIGGKFHRQKVEVDNGNNIIKMAVPSDCSSLRSQIDLGYIHHEYFEYAQVDSIFGEYGIIPKDVFLQVGIDPVDFIRHLVLDYTR
jgi:hypothetical protein